MDDVLEFKKYVEQFNTLDEQILLKYYHSIRVMKICEELAESLSLNDQDKVLAKKIGLLHDIGRFEQLKKYHSFSDKNVDHAILGVSVLFDKQLIKNYDIREEDLEVLKKAILNHNGYDIDLNLNKRELLFSQIIRDADKLEILYRLSVEDVLLKEDESDISKKVNDDFLKEKSIRTTDLEGKNDRIILFLAFSYDLNFQYSFTYLKKNKLYEHIFELINDKDIFEKYFSKVYSYILEKSKGGSYVRKEI